MTNYKKLRKARPKKKYTYNGKPISVRKFCMEHGINYLWVYVLVGKRGYTTEEALHLLLETKAKNDRIKNLTSGND